MRRSDRVCGASSIAFGALVALSLVGSPAWAQRAILKDGRVLDGRFTQIAKVAEDPRNKSDPLALTPILLCDDELRRTMVPVTRLASLEERPFESLEVIRIPQRVATTGQAVAAMGGMAVVAPFDEHGRRVVSLRTQLGPRNVIQGITEISPVYTRLRGLQSTTSFVWDMRIATSSIPRDVLWKIFEKHIERTNVDERLRLVRFFIQAGLYYDAEAELKRVMADFPNEPAPKEMIPQLRQAAVRMVLDDLLARKQAGQHNLVYTHLKEFPSEGVSGNLLEQVRQELTQYGNHERERSETIANLKSLVAQIEPASRRETYEPAIKEIEAELSLNTLDRLAAFRRLEKDASLTTEQKLALAISGWLLGADHAETNVQIVQSLFEMRNLVQRYFTETSAPARDAIYQQIVQQEGASPQFVAQLVARMKPPVATARESSTDYLEIEVPGPPGGSGYKYFALLPPEYDPYRLYPTLITLNGAGTTPLQQIDWWAGAASERGRLGQATRHGYIVIAPVWSKPNQNRYRASAEAHDCVLRTLRDACRRFAIDSDRVYLTGHSMGGDAAWEIGVSHPDYWAGIIPIAATTTPSTINDYLANASLLPMYFVAGELDSQLIVANSTSWDHYFVRRYDVTVVEYRGRGHEHFSDEILRLFDWMGRKRRDFFPKEFNVSTNRVWDSYFWWLEIDKLPIDERQARALQIKGSVTASNTVLVTAPGDVSVWLSPEMIDFSRPINVKVNGRDLSRKPIQPDLRVLLEDVRTRGARLHPFWAKVEAEARK
jgi:predicted esterase